MTSPAKSSPQGLRRFQVRLMLAMMILVSVVTLIGLYVAERNLAARVDHDLQSEFQGGLEALHAVQEQRHLALAELCRDLVRKPRIHAALEDSALDLLYPSAKDELRDVMGSGASKQALQGVFYRFLDQRGAVIPPPNQQDVGELRPSEEARLTLPRLPREHQIGYLVRTSADGRSEVLEVIAMTIISSDTNEAIAALAIGFKPGELGAPGAPGSDRGIRSGIFLEGGLHFPTLSTLAQAALTSEVALAVSAPERAGRSIPVEVEGAPHLLFYKRLNPDSLFPPAYEASLFPLADLLARRRQLRWQVAGTGVVVMLGSLGASHFFSTRLSRPVERLAVDSEENRAQRVRAEAALELTNEGLRRAVRFSADASHQLKTPVTVLRAGLEELLARPDLAAEVREELGTLVHQTYRLGSLIDDLLLLARADAGRLQINYASVDLRHLLEAGLDDLGALPDGVDLAIETDLPDSLRIAGERRYSMIVVENLLENARKYNRPGGRIAVRARSADGWVTLRIANTGQPIPAGMREHIFERFYRAAVGENVPGHGLGLNLARELARLQGGDLRLVRSDDDWTEFEVRFRAAETLAPASLHPA